MSMYRINYEEYLHFEEFIEASTKEEAERQFKNSISELEPVEAEVFDFQVTDVSEEGGYHVGKHNGKKKHVVSKHVATTGFTTK